MEFVTNLAAEAFRVFGHRLKAPRVWQSSKIAVRRDRTRLKEAKDVNRRACLAFYCQRPEWRKRCKVMLQHNRGCGKMEQDGGQKQFLARWRSLNGIGADDAGIAIGESIRQAIVELNRIPPSFVILLFGCWVVFADPFIQRQDSVLHFELARGRLRSAVL